MEFTEKDLISGETILINKHGHKVRYLGSPLKNMYCIDADGNILSFTFEKLNELFVIEQPKSKVVPLEKKIYDFVPVRVRDMEGGEWEKAELFAVIPNTNLSYRVICNGDENSYKYCEFINEK